MKYSQNDHVQNVEKFRIEAAKIDLMYNFPLNQDSLAVDLGGFSGDWSQSIYQKYNCNILIFEPIPDYFEIIQKKFIGFEQKITIINSAIGSFDGFIDISINNDASSIFGNIINKIKVPISKFSHFIINDIDLLKINIEGSEYDVFEDLIKNDKLKNIKNILAQFHRNADNFEDRKENIEKELLKTHRKFFDFEYIWEAWKKI